ncbi:MAG: serine/threonine-protein kinase [Luteolibacter sp.]
MTPHLERLLFTAAASLPEKTDREAFLDFACGGNAALRDELKELLEIQDHADDFFEVPSHSPVPTEMHSHTREETGARIGHYRLIDRLGEGGCGVVYLAEQEEPVRRKVALKIIRLGLDTEQIIARFNLEREALALMDHPNIARVLDAGATPSGRPYFVMELVDGERITDFCDRNRLTLPQRLELFRAVCEGVQHAHQKGIIHRDLKPSNILVRQHGGNPVPKIIDFGIVKTTPEFRENATYTRSEQFLGTPSYMSPEQAAGSSDIDTRSDIYSLGALLFELLTGEPPFPTSRFKGLATEEIRRILNDEEIVTPSSKLRNLPPEDLAKLASQRRTEPHRFIETLKGDLDWIVIKATEKDRTRRYETANALAFDVTQYLQEKPILARPPSRRYTLLKLIRRNRLGFLAGGVALSGLLGGFGVSTWLFFRERDARQQQVKLRIIAEEARLNEARLHAKSQAVDSVAQAAVLLKYGEMEKADALLEKIPPAQIPISLEAVNTIIALSNWNLTRQQWQTAAQRFGLLVEVLSKVETMDLYANAQEWMPAAVTIREWGAPGQYDDFRALAIQRFGQTSDVVVAETLLRVTLLEPAPSHTLSELHSSTLVLEKSLDDDTAEPHLITSRYFALALFAYRQGDESLTRHWANLCLSNQAHRQRALMSRTLLAMCDLRKSRNIEKAANTLQKIREEIEHWETFDSPRNFDRRFSWAYWSAARILLKEAQAMLPET